ncbi:MAG: hydrogenase formation protein HypD [Elusimicrobia bacterium]|nr:hydrogenase formation protein HypD [Elusimicrobiota bacterium]
MKYLDEYRDRRAAQRYAKLLAALTTKPWTVMEICGGQTHSIMRFGIDRLLPPGLQLVHGPGCPVCVTPLELIDRAIAISRRPETVFCSFGDMLRVPGSRSSLLEARAQGADIRVVYSPLDAVELARRLPARQVVFFAVGFETTAPMTAMAARRARDLGLKNFSLLTAHVLVPPAMAAILSAPANRVQGFLAAGHVCTVAGFSDYEPLARRYRVPIVVTGFEPLDILQGLCMLTRQLERGLCEVQNQYGRSARAAGNQAALAVLREVFEPCRRQWRGIGPIESSGLRLTPPYADLDAEKRFGVQEIAAQEPRECLAGEILQGLRKPHECPAFGTLCTPERPLGAPMVSSEGACAAYHRYRGAEANRK